MNINRVYRDILKYVHANNEYGQGTLLNTSNFKALFGFLYFDLTKQKMDIRDGTTKLAFHYELSSTTATDYSIYASLYMNKMLNLCRKMGNYYFAKFYQNYLLISYIRYDKLSFTWCKIVLRTKAKISKSIEKQFSNNNQIIT